MAEQFDDAAHAVNSPLVTVIVGAYNHEHYVERCLDSLAGGEYSHTEIIVFDDASQDRTDNVIRTWITARPRPPVMYQRHERNLGLSRSLNEAIRAATGSYICFISADDVMRSSGIAARVEYLERHPDKLAVFGDACVIDEHGGRIYESAIEELHAGMGMRKDQLRIDPLVPSSIVFHWAVPGPVLMCRATAFNAVGHFDEGLRVEDWDMYLRIAARGGLGFVDEYVAEYRVHRASLSAILLGAEKRADMAKTARKNAGLFGPINAARLWAVYAVAQIGLAQTRRRRLVYVVTSKVLLLVSYRAYVLKRAYLKYRHRRRQASR